MIVTPELVGEGENDYFKVPIDPHEWLFKYKEKTSATTYTLKSILEIFDAFQVDRQVILIQGAPGSGKMTLANNICREWGMHGQIYTTIFTSYSSETERSQDC